ncbi:MAG TPA: DUF3082 domain-containing protein [Cyanobacteria bacterium UBA11369]|nr:DUF3082 domain-containing protein [Cyanobacteria bacterium UBA11371]HBE34838.1 DUF3082 domain-containing protein [Cyanobacteria bacterium UBA11368]HBE48259.1 DUF3082 domain-containing protein [Cyanobacteria bacterium UBA11369]
MTDPTPNQAPETQSNPSNKALPGPLRCLSGAVVAGGLAIALYSLTSSIASNFASKPIQSDNFTVVNITVAVRTLVVGTSALATGIFGLIAIGLAALAIQVLFNRPAAPTDAKQ